MEKICSKCKIPKELDQFPKDKTNKDGHDYYCKLCKKARIKQHYNDPLKKELHNKKSRDWNDNPKNRKSRLASHQKYNKKKLLEPAKKLAHHLGTHLYNAVKKQGKFKNSKTLKAVGLKDWNQFINHIESTWIEGMNWSNYGVGKDNTTWHIDHFKPISKAKNKKDVIKLSHYTNLKAMWGSDNIRKSNK
jgi:hypothetical protein